MDGSLLSILEQFFPNVGAEKPEIVPLKSGLINETYRVNFDGESFILQRINTEIFKDPEALQENCRVISTFLTKKELTDFNCPPIILTPIPTQTGKLLYQVGDEVWRMFPFFDHTDCFDVVRSPEHAFQAAIALANFHRILGDIDPKQLTDPLPNFLNFSARLEHYHQAKLGAKADRLEAAKSELNEVNELLPTLIENINTMDQLPKRVIHGDPKISNFLFYEHSTEVAGLIDLDTMMEGTILYDIGDMVRSFTNRKREDNDDHTPAFDEDIFGALLAGYLHESAHLSAAELQNWVVGAQTVIAIQAIRFLTDYLNGDVYYSVTDSRQNLRRTRNQLQLLTELNNYSN